MSASTKKKLRNELEAAKLTERQIAEQKEAKKLKLYTTTFVIVLVAILVIAATIGATQFIKTSGMREKNTVAMTVNSNELSNADLNYFYIDAVNNFYSQNGSYVSIFGLDVTKPLNEQTYDEASGQTWADYFVDMAKSNATSVHALADAAAAAGYTLPAEQQETADSIIYSMEAYSTLYGYTDAESYLKAMYGMGADLDSYRSYVEKSVLADAFQADYSESLTYADADLRAAEAENFNKYSSFAYNYYYLSAASFQESEAPTDEEKAAARAAAEEAAKTLTADTITTAEELDAAIAALPVNEGKTAASTRYDANLYGNIAKVVAEWLSDSSRKEGDLTYLKNAATAEDGTETVNGYYVIRFDSVTDNTFALKNVRHILVNFEGGTTDEMGMTTYTDEEKAAAKTAAEEILAQWKSGEATEASFAGLAAEKSGDPGSTANGGLYEDIYPGQMVPAFDAWCFDESRKAGDTGIVETEYGYHVMYFSGNSDTNYRDYQIRNELRSNDLTEWYNGIVESAAVTEGSTQHLALDLVLSR